MKKIIVLIVIAFILIVGGCDFLGTQPKPKPAKIVVSRIEEEPSAMSEIRVKDNIAFTISRAILTLECPEWGVGMTTKIQAYLYDDANNIIETPVLVTKPPIVPPYTDCWRFSSQNDPETTGAYGDFVAQSPGGIGLARLEAMGITFDLPLLVYQTWKDLPQNTGIALGLGEVPGGESVFHVSNNEAECFLWNDSPDLKKVILKGKSYFVGEQPGHWYDCPNFVDIKTVDQNQIDSGATDRVLDYNKIYVGAVSGGYVKLFYTKTFPAYYMYAVIFEFSPDGNFL